MPSFSSIDMQVNFVLKKWVNMPKTPLKRHTMCLKTSAALLGFSQSRDFSGMFSDFLLIPGIFFKVGESPATNRTAISEDLHHFKICDKRVKPSRSIKTGPKCVGEVSR